MLTAVTFTLTANVHEKGNLQRKQVDKVLVA